jgi:prepilin-type N-terminal cleavage/methylation domain-containing protein
MSTMKKIRKSSGFTIIEVMIVLAIAGLILAVVLVAIPQLQKNQRNEARRSVLARISAEVNNYIGNNEGAVPTNGSGDRAFTDGFLERYIENAPAGTFDKPTVSCQVARVLDETLLSLLGLKVVRHTVSIISSRQ